MVATEQRSTAWATSLVQFSRPHTIVGTVVAVVGLHVLARTIEAGPGPAQWTLLTALVGGLAANIYVVGLNQLTDVEVDRINKPWLPLPAGRLSPGAARWIVLTALVLGLGVGALASVWLLTAVMGTAVIGTAYSLPPVRLKRHHALAAASIVTTRGVVVNLCIFLHYQTATGAAPAVPAPVWLLTAVVVVLGLVIAWFKDLADMEGDRRHLVGTLPLVVGPRPVVRAGVGILLGTYAAAAVGGGLAFEQLHGPTLVTGHLLAALALLLAAARVQLDDRRSIEVFYRRIWLLFYAEYGIISAAALAA